LRLEHNTVERKTNQNIYITSDEKIKKGDCFIENGVYHFRKFLTSIRYWKESKIINNRPKLNQRECKPLMSFWSGS
jgi:hypothetical protein